VAVRGSGKRTGCDEDDRNADEPRQCRGDGVQRHARGRSGSVANVLNHAECRHIRGTRCRRSEVGGERLYEGAREHPRKRYERHRDEQTRQRGRAQESAEGGRERDAARNDDGRSLHPVDDRGYGQLQRDAEKAVV
jgi:hypothetical protein